MKANGTKDALVYRLAARCLENRQHFYSCNAMTHVGASKRQIAAFKAVYGPDAGGTKDHIPAAAWDYDLNGNHAPTSDHAIGQRVIALCFMAAMVESRAK